MIIICFPSNNKLFKQLPQGISAWEAQYPDFINATSCSSAYVLGSIMCSCDYYRTDAEKKINALRKKHIKSGWTPNKILRALDGIAEWDFIQNLYNPLIKWITNEVADCGECFLSVHWTTDNIADYSIVEIPASVFTSSQYVVPSGKILHIIQ